MNSNINFSTPSFPTRKDEAYRYLNISEIKEKSDEFNYHQTNIQAVDPRNYFDKSSYNIVFLNGIYLDSDCSDFIKKSLPKLAQNNYDYFEYINNSSIQEGLSIDIPKNTIVSKPFNIVYLANNALKNKKTFTNTSININENSHVQINENFLSIDEEQIPAIQNNYLEIKLEQKSRCNYNKLHSNYSDYNLSSLQVFQKKESNFQGFFLNSRSKLNRQKIKINLEQERSSAELSVVALSKKQQNLNFLVDIIHSSPNCTSSQLFKSIAAENSQSSYQGNIHVTKNGSKTKAYQLIKALLMGEKSQSNLKPQLLIDTDDVKCSHGATIAKLQDKELLYLRNRGISKKSAYKMLAFAFIKEALEKNKQMIFYKKIHEKIIPDFLNSCNFLNN